MVNTNKYISKIIHTIATDRFVFIKVPTSDTFEFLHEFKLFRIIAWGYKYLIKEFLAMRAVLVGDTLLTTTAS